MVKLVLFVGLMLIVVGLVGWLMVKHRRSIGVLLFGLVNLIFLYSGSWLIYQFLYQNNINYPTCDIDPECMNENGLLLVMGLFLLFVAFIFFLIMLIFVVKNKQRNR